MTAHHIALRNNIPSVRTRLSTPIPVALLIFIPYIFLFFFSVESHESADCFSLASFTECSLSAFLQQYFVSLLFGEYLLYVHTHTL